MIKFNFYNVPDETRQNVTEISDCTIQNVFYKNNSNK